MPAATPSPLMVPFPSWAQVASFRSLPLAPSQPASPQVQRQVWVLKGHVSVCCAICIGESKPQQITCLIPVGLLLASCGTQAMQWGRMQVSALQVPSMCMCLLYAFALASSVAVSLSKQESHRLTSGAAVIIFGLHCTCICCAD